MIEFKNKKGKLLFNVIAILMISTISLLVNSYLDKNLNGIMIFIIVMLMTVSFYLIFINTKTKYTVQNERLVYKSGLMQGHIDISEIRKITIGKTMWSGKKPATATKGLIIRYNKFDEIYISPEFNYRMVEELLKINHKIEIEDLTKTSNNF